jgi:hypothetical protein
MREMLNVDTESLKKFQFRYGGVYLGRSSFGRRTRTSIFGSWSSCSRNGNGRTRR